MAGDRVAADTPERERGDLDLEAQVTMANRSRSACGTSSRSRSDGDGAPVPGTTVEEPWLGRVATADGLFVTDEQQRIVTWSAAAERMLGYSAEEVVGQPCFLVVAGREPDGHPVCRDSCPVTKNARRLRGTPSYDVVARGRDGSMRWLSNSVLVLDGPKGAFRVMHLLRETHPAPVAGPLPRNPIEDGPAQLAPEDDADRPATVENLTRRELEVLRMVGDAATIDEIATALSISVFTARNHVASAQRKLGARNRLELVIIGMRSGLI